MVDAESADTESQPIRHCCGVVVVTEPIEDMKTGLTCFAAYKKAHQTLSAGPNDHAYVYGLFIAPTSPLPARVEQPKLLFVFSLRGPALDSFLSVRKREVVASCWPHHTMGGDRSQLNRIANHNYERSAPAGNAGLSLFLPFEPLAPVGMYVAAAPPPPTADHPPQPAPPVWRLGIPRRLIGTGGGGGAVNTRAWA